MTGGDEGLRPWTGAGALIVAFVLSTVLIVLLRPLLRRYALARPNSRSSHRDRFAGQRVYQCDFHSHNAGRSADR